MPFVNLQYSCGTEILLLTVRYLCDHRIMLLSAICSYYHQPLIQLYQAIDKNRDFITVARKSKYLFEYHTRIRVVYFFSKLIDVVQI